MMVSTSGKGRRALLSGVFVWAMVSFFSAPEALATSLQVEVGEDVVVLDLVQDIPAGLQLAEFQTETVWTDGTDRYAGVLVADLLQHLGVDTNQPDATVTFHALDGYSGTLSFQMVIADRPLLSFLRNGETMSRREQGPYWLVFDFDGDARFRAETYYALSVWQIERIVIAQ